MIGIKPAKPLVPLSFKHLAILVHAIVTLQRKLAKILFPTTKTSGLYKALSTMSFTDFKQCCTNTSFHFVQFILNI